MYATGDEGLADLMTRLAAEECDSAVVVDGQDRFIGTVHLTDVPANGMAHSSVASVMRDSRAIVEPDTRLERLIPLAVDGDAPIAVLDDGLCIGTISREAVMAALVGDDGVAT